MTFKLSTTVTVILGVTLFSTLAQSAEIDPEPYELRMPISGTVEAQEDLSQNIIAWTQFLDDIGNTVPSDWNEARMSVSSGSYTLISNPDTNADYVQGSNMLPNEAIPATALPTGYMFFSNFPGITHLNFLSRITSLGTISIANNGLTDISGLSNLVSVLGNTGIKLNDNDALTNVDGLSSLQTVEADLNLGSLDTLTSVAGLASLTSVGRNLVIQACPLLTNVDGLNSLTSASTIDISYNNLSNINGLSSLTTANRIVLTGNPLLTDISGIRNINPISSRTRISVNENVYSKIDASSSLCTHFSNATGLVELTVGGARLSDAAAFTRFCS